MSFCSIRRHLHSSAWMNPSKDAIPRCSRPLRFRHTDWTAYWTYNADFLHSWDEWVPEQRLHKLNEAGFAKRRQLLEQQSQKTRPGSADSPAPSKGKDKAAYKKDGSRKRARDSGVDTVSFCCS